MILSERNGSSYLNSCGAIDEPDSHFRLALLTVALALSVVFLALLTTLGPSQHIIKLDLHASTGLTNDPIDDRRVPWQRLSVTPMGQVSLNGMLCQNLSELSMAVQFLMIRSPLPGVRLQVAPEARHEDFVALLAVLKRSGVELLRVDTAPLPDAEDHSLVLSAKRQNLPGSRKRDAFSSDTMLVRATTPRPSPSVMQLPSGCAAHAALGNA